MEQFEAMDLLTDLDRRGLINAHTDRDALAARLAAGPLTLYCGFDPTAPSLGWWNLQNLILLRRFQEHGHRPIALAGGATGMIGDPSGRREERVLLDDSTLAVNVAGITADMARVIDFDGPAAGRVVDNSEWTRSVSLIEFLRDVGKHVTVNQMVARDSVRSRMDSEHGISFTEFAYMLLQGFDFLWLYEHENCELQIGGSDQWGNIIVGVDLIRRRLGGIAHAMTSPLLVDRDGNKIGKSTGGTVFMHPDLTSPYQFFQHWMQMPDDMVGELLRKFTFLGLDEIDELVAEHAACPEQRSPQRRLAHEVTALVHGEAAATAAAAAAQALFGGDVDRASVEVFEMLAGEVPLTRVPSDRLLGGTLVDLLVEARLCSSKGDARRQIGQGAVYLNGNRVADAEAALATGDLIHSRYCLLRLGKHRYHLLQLA